MKILLADDQTLFREGISPTLGKLSDPVMILEAGNFEEAISISHSHPDLAIALLDLNMPDSGGASAVEIFRTHFPHIPVVVLSGSDQREDIENAIMAGAMGFISKRSTGKTMLAALRLVLDGEIYLPPQIVLQPASGPRKKDRRSTCTDRHGLTGRQREVFLLISQGMSNKEIAQTLGLSEGTVKIHVAALFQHLNVGSRIEAIRVGKQLGLETVAEPG